MEGPRLVRPEETAALCRLLCDVFGFDNIYAEERFRQALARSAHRRGALVIVEEGRPVSHILTTIDDLSLHGCRTRVASIGGVATEERWRNRGYAGAILAESLRRMEARGARVLIVSGDRSLYRRNHCVPAGEVWQGRLSQDVLARPAPAGLSVACVGADAWPELAPIYAAEPVHFVRGRDFLSRCCVWWDCYRPEVWAVRSHGETIAYLLLHPVGPDGPAARLTSEWAGPRAAVLDALPLIAAEAGLVEVHVRAPRYDHELIYLLRARGVALHQGRLAGTQRLVNLPGLMRDLRTYLAARLPAATLRRLRVAQEGESCLFALGEEELRLSLSDAARLVLGGAERPAVAGELGEALARAFPIPFPMPGFNYV